jgi:hypothetical protein
MLQADSSTGLLNLRTALMLRFRRQNWIVFLPMWQKRINRTTFAERKWTAVVIQGWTFNYLDNSSPSAEGNWSCFNREPAETKLDLTSVQDKHHTFNELLIYQLESLEESLEYSSQIIRSYSLRETQDNSNWLDCNNRYLRWRKSCCNVNPRRSQSGADYRPDLSIGL